MPWFAVKSTMLANIQFPQEMLAFFTEPWLKYLLSECANNIVWGVGGEEVFVLKCHCSSQIRLLFSCHAVNCLEFLTLGSVLIFGSIFLQRCHSFNRMHNGFPDN